MIIVTGAAGFIGSNIIKGLNAKGITDIIAVDDLTDGKKYRNLAVVSYKDYMDYEVFLEYIQTEDCEHKIDAIFHQGSCSDTTEWNGRYMMENNYEYSKIVLHFCLEKKIPFVCFSSSGGARMQEALFSLMQMAKTSAALAKFSEAGLPYISVLTNQTRAFFALKL